MRAAYETALGTRDDTDPLSAEKRELLADWIAAKGGDSENLALIHFVRGLTVSQREALERILACGGTGESRKH